MKRRWWRVIRWLVAGVLSLALLVVATVVIFTRTAHFNDFLRGQLVSYLAQNYRGQVSIGSIEGSIWGSLTLRNITLRHDGSDVVSIPQLRVGYQILPALHGQFVLSDVDVVKPELHLARDRDGQWNLLAAIAERNPSPPSPPPNISIALRRFAIEQAAVSVTTTPSATYRLTDGNFSGAGQIGRSSQTFDIEKIAFSLRGPGMLPVRAQGSLTYNESRQLATIKVPDFALSTSRSRIDLTATVSDLRARNVEATLNLRKLAADDINSIAPQANLARDLSGIVRIHGNPAALQAVAALTAGQAHFNTRLSADVSKPQPTWSIQTQLAKVDLRMLLKLTVPEELPAGVIDAALHADGIGTSVATIKGGIDARVTGLALRGMRLGDASIIATANGPATNIKAQMNGPSGRVQLNGRFDIARQPAYNFSLALEHLRPANLIRDAKIPPADLNLTSTINGVGYQPNVMRTRIQIRWLPSTVGAVRIDSGLIDAQLASGTVQVASATLRAADTTVDASGQLPLNPNGNGTLRYAATVGQASRWLALVGQRGSGQVDLSGQAQGNLRNLRVSGALELTALKIANYSAAHARLTCDIAGLGATPKPSGQLMLLASDLHTGIVLKSLQSTVRLVAAPTQTATVDLNAEDRFSHPASLRAEVSYRPALIVVNLSHMLVATQHGSWQLAAPAELTKKGPALAVHRFLATNQTQSLTLDGGISQLGAQDFTARLQAVRLADFSGFFSAHTKVEGVASSELTIRGSAAAPLITASAHVVNLQVAGFPQAALSARATYSGGRAQAEATLAQNSTHSLAVTVTLPAQLAWAHGFDSRITGDLDLRAFSKGLDLAVLNTIRNHEVSGIDGLLSLDVSAHGPLRHPVPNGFIRVSNGRALIRQTKVQISAGAADLELGPGAVRLVSLSAKAGDGTLTGNGALALAPDGTPGHLEIHVALNQWPAVASHQYDAVIAANLDASGTLTATDISGQIEVLHAVFRPDLSVAGGPPRPDQTVTVVQRWGATPHQPPPSAQSGPTGLLPGNLAVDLRVVIDRNTWIKTPDFAVEMEGDLHVRKKRRGSLIVYGTIKTVRGTLVVAQREFDLTRGYIMFTGGHRINPELEIVAQRREQNYLVSATIGGTANKPTLKLSSIPDLPQADILSVMMFGKPSSQLSGGQQKDLQNQALSMAGGYAASQVGQAVAQALGLGDLGVTTNSGGVGIGRYLSKNVYVAATQSASNMRDRRAEIQYSLTPSINLNTSASTNYGNEIKLQWHKEY